MLLNIYKNKYIFTLYICIYIYIYVCVCVCRCIYTHTYIYMSKDKQWERKMKDEWLAADVRKIWRHDTPLSLGLFLFFFKLPFPSFSTFPLPYDLAPFLPGTINDPKTLTKDAVSIDACNRVGPSLTITEVPAIYSNVPTVGLKSTQEGNLNPPTQILDQLNQLEILPRDWSSLQLVSLLSFFSFSFYRCVLFIFSILNVFLLFFIFITIILSAIFLCYFLFSVCFHLSRLRRS